MGPWKLLASAVIALAAPAPSLALPQGPVESKEGVPLRVRVVDERGHSLRSAGFDRDWDLGWGDDALPERGVVVSEAWRYLDPRRGVGRVDEGRVLWPDPDGFGFFGVVPRGRGLDLAVLHRERGLVERAFTPFEVARISASLAPDEAWEITLAMPREREPGRLALDAVGEGRLRGTVSVRSPQLGLVVCVGAAWQGLSSATRRPFEVELPPGNYSLSRVPVTRVWCGNTTAYPWGSLAHAQTCAVLPAKRTIVDTSTPEGSTLHLRVELEGGVESLPNWSPFGPLGEARWLEEGGEARWVEVSIEGRGAPSPHDVRWASKGSFHEGSRQLALDSEAFLLPALPAGRYRLRFEGPAIEPLDAVVELPKGMGSRTYALRARRAR